MYTLTLFCTLSRPEGPRPNVHTITGNSPEDCFRRFAEDRELDRDEREIRFPVGYWQLYRGPECVVGWSPLRDLLARIEGDGADEPAAVG